MNECVSESLLLYIMSYLLSTKYMVIIISNCEATAPRQELRERRQFAWTTAPLGARKSSEGHFVGCRWVLVVVAHDGVLRVLHAVRAGREQGHLQRQQYAVVVDGTPQKRRVTFCLLSYPSVPCCVEPSAPGGGLSPRCQELQFF